MVNRVLLLTFFTPLLLSSGYSVLLGQDGLSEGQLYLAGQQHVWRSDLDGTNLEQLSPAYAWFTPDGIAVDALAEKIYWTGHNYDIWSADLDGENLKYLGGVTMAEDPHAIALDLAQGHLYWSEGTGVRIARANLDGTEPQTLVSGATGWIDGLALDLDDRKMYWTEDSGRIRRSNLDGSHTEVLVAGINGPGPIALNLDAGKMYWSDMESIIRTDLSGDNREEVIDMSAAGIVLDVAQNHIYWTPGKQVHRASLDGNDQELVIGDVSDFVGAIALTRAEDGESALQAGDANQDLRFDQLDLVQVLQAAKYLTGEAATWGEGDWEGGPGGYPGKPPAGDDIFDQKDIVSALQSGVYLSGAYAAIAPGGVRGDEQTSIVYDARTGEIAVDAPKTTELSAIGIDSAAGIFTGSPAENLGSSFDNHTDDNIFKMVGGFPFGSHSYGNVAQPGLPEVFVLEDLTVYGSLFIPNVDRPPLGPVDLVYIPEPPGLALAWLAVIALGVFMRRARQHVA